MIQIVVLLKHFEGEKGKDRLKDAHGQMQSSTFSLSNMLSLLKQTLPFNTHSHN